MLGKDIDEMFAKKKVIIALRNYGRMEWVEDDT
jgi:hypothetical protein